MSKLLPITRRLEVALAETTSFTERDIVYGLLARFCTQIDCNGIEQKKLYKGINHKTFSVIENKRNISREDTQEGRELANYLKRAVSLPTTGEKKYREKMLQAIDIEFSSLKNFYCEDIK